MVQRPGRAGEGLPLCEPGEGPVGPGGARELGSSEAALGALGAREPDASHADVERRRGARGPTVLPEPILLPPPPTPSLPLRARGTGVHGPAKGTFATFERARTGWGRGGDRASGARAACPATAQRKARAGEERRGPGASVPRPPGASQGCPPPHLGWGVIEGGSLPHGNHEVTPLSLTGRRGREVGLSPPLSPSEGGDR